jgi:hypothetical protein
MAQSIGYYGRLRLCLWGVSSLLHQAGMTHPISIRIGSRGSTIRPDLFAATVPMLITSALMSGRGSKATTASGSEAYGLTIEDSKTLRPGSATLSMIIW